MRVLTDIWYRVPVIFLIFTLANTALTYSQELPVKIGDEKKTVINKLGCPEKTKLFNSGTERLFYSDLMIDIRGDKAVIIRSTNNYQGSVFSVRRGDNVNRVKKLLGEPDESDENQLVYYDHKGSYLHLYLDKKRKSIGTFFIKKGCSKEAMEERKKKLATLVEKGLIPSDEELRSNLLKKVAHERVTEREYKKNKRQSQRFATESHTITGYLKNKNPGFSPVEKSHDIDKRMNKFVVEYMITEDGVTKRILQDCFLDRHVASLKNKFNSLSIGDRVTIRGRWKYLEDTKKTKKKDFQIEERMSINIFSVDRIE